MGKERENMYSKLANCYLLIEERKVQRCSYRYQKKIFCTQNSSSEGEIRRMKEDTMIKERKEKVARI